MAVKINPFNPNSPVNPGMFAGRGNELIRLDSALQQTRAGFPKNFMITGERGIGKTSLLDYIRDVAAGEIADFDDKYLNFLVVQLDIDSNTSQLSLMERIEATLERNLGKTEKARKFLKESWRFLKKLEAGGVRLREDQISSKELLLDDFAYSLAKTVNRITDADVDDMFDSAYDGILLMIDECDKASKDLDLGSFLKLLLERVQRNGCRNFMVGIAGLPNLRDVLYSSHESSLRLFDEMKLDRLDSSEIFSVIDSCLRSSKEINGFETRIDEAAKEFMAKVSEGYPHFIQQVGYCTFDYDDDNFIDKADVAAGSFGEGEAMALIGDRYYRDDYYNKIQKDAYRRVLRIMADSGSDWVKKADIKKKFTGKDSTLDNALQALRKRNIIQTKQGARGVYRLQSNAFALWIRLYTDQSSFVPSDEPF
ncbi:MAG: ATP-binding protein [Verrucomicrobiales bacterium]|nr:ATP-binding protein [Verrucomicrobiales bacterium]